ncbi:MAG: hypothetical protein OEZ59_04240 [Deltaproteobacteria bacterium]|nr:hypothetical protein [Deltaproteobacteria bacterium]
MIKNDWAVESIKLLKENGVRTTVIDNEQYVSHRDYTEYIKGLVEQVVDVARQQQEEVLAVAQTLDILNEILADKYPEVLRDLQSQVQKRLTAC